MAAVATLSGDHSYVDHRIHYEPVFNCCPHLVFLSGGIIQWKQTIMELTIGYVAGIIAAGIFLGSIQSTKPPFEVDY